MPHGSAVYQQCWVPLSVLRQRTAYGRHPAPLLQRPQSSGMRRGQRARALMRSLLADPSRPGQRRTRHPFHPLAEEKAVRSLRIDRVTEKNQKNEKLLTEKTGRFSRKAHTGKVAIGTRLVHLCYASTPLCLRGETPL